MHWIRKNQAQADRAATTGTNLDKNEMANVTSSDASSEREHELEQYPPLRVVVPTMMSLYLAFFLVAIVSTRSMALAPQHTNA